MTLRSRDKVALGIVAAVFVAVAFYFIVLSPQLSKVSSLNAQLSTEHQELARSEATYRAGKAAEASLRVNGARWAALRRAVPERADIPALLRTLQRSADDAHVKMQAISLTGAADSTSQGTTTPSSTGANAVPVSLTFTGDYLALTKLMHKLDSLVLLSRGRVHASGPLVNVSNVTLTPSATGLSAQLTASIYQLTEPATSAATEATP